MPDDRSVNVIQHRPVHGVSQSLFRDPVTSLVGWGANAIACGRFRGVGQPLDIAVGGVDIAASGTGHVDTVYVALGHGDGTFQSVVPYRLPSQHDPFEIIAADFSGTGRPDLVVRIANASAAIDAIVDVLRHDPAHPGAFLAAESHGRGRASAMAVGRFRGAGQPLDIAFVGSVMYTLDTVWVMAGDGVGGFQDPVLAAPLGSSAYDLKAADVDGDGRDDLIVTTGQWKAGDARVSVLLSNGDGTFRAGTYFQAPASQHLADIAVARLRGPHQPLDLAVTYTDWNQDTGIYVLLGNGHGGFTLAGSCRLPSPYYFTGDIVAADFTGDGALDFVVTATATGGGNGVIAILAGDGSGNVQLLDKRLPFLPTYTTGGTQPCIAAGDFSGEGMSDVAVISGLDVHVRVLRNQLRRCGAVTLATKPRSPQPAGARVAFIASTAALGILRPTYQFWTYSCRADVWTLAQDWSTTGSLEIDTAGWRPGTYRATVLARTGRGTAPIDWASVDYVLT
jgi:VCBS repeat protein/FG-GAP repeat protein